MPLSQVQFRPAVDEIRVRIQALPKSKNPAASARYIGSVGHEDREADEQSRLKFLGLSMPQVHALAKSQYSFSELPLEKQAKIWLDLYHSSEIYDELILALVWLSHPSRWDWMLTKPSVIFQLQDRVDNWALSDTVSEFIASLVESDPKNHFKQLKKWNSSKKPWERRQSLVGLYCYARGRKRPLPAQQTLPLVEELIDDPHYFVQKAVGWCLREVHHVDTRAQKAFVEKHLDRLTSIAFATATEKYLAKDKAVLKERRARRRKKLK